jgi:hypothetical protein
LVWRRLGSWTGNETLRGPGPLSLFVPVPIVRNYHVSAP